MRRIAIALTFALVAGCSEPAAADIPVEGTTGEPAASTGDEVEGDSSSGGESSTGEMGWAGEAAELAVFTITSGTCETACGAAACLDAAIVFDGSRTDIPCTNNEGGERECTCGFFSAAETDRSTHAISSCEPLSASCEDYCAGEGLGSCAGEIWSDRTDGIECVATTHPANGDFQYVWSPDSTRPSSVAEDEPAVRRFVCEL